MGIFVYVRLGDQNFRPAQVDVKKDINSNCSLVLLLTYVSKLNT